MPGPAFIGLALVLVAAASAWAAAAPAWAGDRLERFREIAAARLAVVEDTGRALDPASHAEMDALLDGEVLDSLQVGGPFASVEFIRERLDSFAEAWGGASLRIDPLGGGVLAGRFRLSARGVSNSGWLYGSANGRPALLRAWQEDGAPEVHPWSSPPGGGAQVLVSWSGTATGWGSWPLSVELWRVRDGLVSPVWRSAERYPEGLWVSQVDIKPGRINLRREVRYPGWKPGCDVQAEQEDRYRSDPLRGLALVSRQLFNGWHRDLARSATRFFSASRRETARRSTSWCRTRRSAPGYRRVSRRRQSATSRTVTRPAPPSSRPPRRCRTAGGRRGRSGGAADHRAGG